MRSYLDCIPCFVRQALESVRQVTDDSAVHEQVLRDVLRRAKEMDLNQTPPMMGRYIHRLIGRHTGVNDPYQAIKKRYNQLALRLYPELQEKIRRAENPLDCAVRLAIAGNIIDFGPSVDLAPARLEEIIEQSVDEPLPLVLTEKFREAVQKAHRILYLADNAGEIVFDRLLIEQLPYTRITLAVRGAPIINDATLEDARTAGLTELVEVIDNGADAPGTILELCSESFRQCFEQADLIIAKGQGNYETLSDISKNIIFLLKAKCAVIARHLGCSQGSMVVHSYNGIL